MNSNKYNRKRHLADLDKKREIAENRYRTAIYYGRFLLVLLALSIALNVFQATR